MLEDDKKFVCINCGGRVDEIYKQYSPSVLKLQNCIFCQNIVDKYVEYDSVIILIDLVLLKREAYRHVIYNTNFSIHWKLAILMQLMEAYSEWMLNSVDYKNAAGKAAELKKFHASDTDFFKLCFKVAFKTSSFVACILLLTLFYNKVLSRGAARQPSLWQVWKCGVLSSFGVFLFLPSLIWDENPVQEFHLLFVSLYTTFSQLLAYTVVCNCPKIWSVVVILICYYCKESSIHTFENVYNHFVSANTFIFNISI